MSVYFIKGKGWRYDFTLNGIRHTEAGLKTKLEARKAEAKRREVLESPAPKTAIQTDMAFLDLVNRRLDNVKAYHSAAYYGHYVYMARRWVKMWGKLLCGQITQDMVEQFIFERKKVSAYTANKEIRYLRALFNFARKKELIARNPVDGIEFLPVTKKLKYIPSSEDIDKVIAVADPDIQDYLWTIRETMARMSEINRLTWDDVNLERAYVILYTRKKRGGHLTPRKVAMTEKLHQVLSQRHAQRDENKPWVFWHTYTSSKTGEKKEGPYNDRKKIMRTLCRKAGVKYFRFHALRHSGASIMDNCNVPLSAIQRILGHENRSTTEIYLHSISEIERAAITVYERARQGTLTNSHTNSHTSQNCNLDV